MLTMTRKTAAVVVATLLAACNSGPSESEYLAVCLKEGQTRVNQAITKQMGVDRDAYCKCEIGRASCRERV